MTTEDDDLDLLLATRAKLLEADAELRTKLDGLAFRLDSELQQGRRYRHFFDANDEARVVADLNGTIREANTAACDLFGLPPAFLAGKPLAVFVEPADMRAFRDAVSAAAHVEVRVPLGIRGRGKQAVRVELHGVPLPDGARSLWFISLEAPA